VSSVRVAPTPASVGYVRAVLRDDLAVLPEMVREEVALVASELLGNAVRHARALDDGQLVIDWGVGEDGVEIAVTDGGGDTKPEVSNPAPTEISGRGLSIVATLSARWGVEQHGSLTTVWAIVPLGTGAAARAVDTGAAQIRSLRIRTVDIRDE
jgi:anti-sigma regulatory factor (Ser/Thr protein kinase)